jgi:hypothetical protein
MPHTLLQWLVSVAAVLLLIWVLEFVVVACLFRRWLRDEPVDLPPEIGGTTTLDSGFPDRSARADADVIHPCYRGNGRKSPEAEDRP